MKRGNIAIIVLLIFAFCSFILAKIWQLLYIRLNGIP
ncbi:hypothetical protein Tmel_0885 [Thermosipho melanesiensis BI429]|uniref:Uncharacterized protein n=1 Tax=Thermosipho melanesiensis (strain DSM 12029 / CIP 104789 / BI429) TaxID=391009 RepID=A6LLE5_THEM4|nr:hypothetical protein Tmel_0885 [Thermosipho melanesiensis BI429]